MTISNAVVGEDSLIHASLSGRSETLCGRRNAYVYPRGSTVTAVDCEECAKELVVILKDIASLGNSEAEAVRRELLAFISRSADMGT